MAVSSAWVERTGNYVLSALPAEATFPAADYMHANGGEVSLTPTPNISLMEPAALTAWMWYRTPEGTGVRVRFGPSNGLTNINVYCRSVDRHDMVGRQYLTDASFVGAGYNPDGDANWHHLAMTVTRTVGASAVFDATLFFDGAAHGTGQITKALSVHMAAGMGGLSPFLADTTDMAAHGLLPEALSSADLVTLGNLTAPAGAPVLS